MGAYYNEIDEKAAAWLRELIARGLIADGVVDTRSIEDVTPADLAGFTQCHFFAGIGVWSYALRRAGWPDDRPVWTGSCPCQPFSAAGKGGGFADERHLWPAFHWLIEQCRPPVVFGEQVASKDGLAWLDLVQADLEGSGYASRAVDFCAAGVGAPHIRQRLYWVADAAVNRVGAFDGKSRSGVRRQEPVGRHSVSERLAHHHHQGLEGRGQPGRERAAERAARESGVAGGLADSADPRHDEAREHQRGPSQLSARPAEHGGVVRPAGSVNGLWRDADWLLCRDGKWRPVEARAQSLVDGIADGVGRGGDRSAEELARAEIGFPLGKDSPGRVGRLRGYGNGLVAPAAQAFIESWLEATGS